MKLRFLVVAIPLLMQGQSVLAQSKPEILKRCESFNATPDTAAAQEVLEAIQGWDYLFSEETIRRANECVTKLTGQPAAYLAGSGIVTGKEADDVIQRNKAAESQREAKEAERLEWEERLKSFSQPNYKKLVVDRKCKIRKELLDLREIIASYENARADQRVETTLTTIRECRDWYFNDRIAALSNDVCNKTFLDYGLPDSEISLPDYEDRIQAESKIGSLEGEYKILEEFGFLFSDAIAYSAYLGKENRKDDECDGS